MRRLLVLLPGEAQGDARRHALRLRDAARRLGLATTVAPLEPATVQGAEEWRGKAQGGFPAGPGAAARRAQAEVTRAALSDAVPDAVLLPLARPGQGAGALEALAEARVPALVVAHAAAVGTPAAPEPGLVAAARGMRAAWAAGSAATAGQLARIFGLHAGQVDVIPNGVERQPPVNREAARAALRAVLGVGPGVPVALFEGELDAAGGADRLPALALEFARRSGGVIACRGTGVLEAAMRGAAPGDHPLRMLPAGPRASAPMAGADLLILPSRLGDLPDCFLEAAFLHLPVAATAQALQALGQGAGLFAVLADVGQAGGMAAAMQACLDQGGPAVARLENAWRLADSWDAEAMADRYMALLRRLAAPPLGDPEGR